MGRRYALRDDQWEVIKDLLPRRAETVGATARDSKSVEPMAERVCPGQTQQLRHFVSTSP